MNHILRQKFDKYDLPLLMHFFLFSMFSNVNQSNAIKTAIITCTYMHICSFYFENGYKGVFEM